MYLVIAPCLSEMNADITTSHADKNPIQFWNAKNSIAGLLPASFCCKENKVDLVTENIVREAEVILLTFSRGKSILLLNCSLGVQ